MHDVKELVKKAYYNYKENNLVHIGLRNKYFYNGRIKEVLENEYILLLDRLYGEVVLYFNEIATIETYTGDINDSWINQLVEESTTN